MEVNYIYKDRESYFIVEFIFVIFGCYYLSLIGVVGMFFGDEDGIRR